MPDLRDVPTHVVTGFLGAGKSSVILNLLEQKPSDENWAVLVNEFGEIGIDGSLISGATDRHAGIFVREVAGGCMCCTAGIPMQMAMSMLLARAKPARLLIEPTGLGHPVEVLDVLRSAHYRDVLDLRATVTLVDARKLGDTRYTSHEVFNQQLAIADVVVASKADLYGEAEVNALRRYLAANSWAGDVTVSEHGRLALNAIDSKAADVSPPVEETALSPAPPLSPEADMQPPFPPEGFLRMENRGAPFSSIGWLFKKDFVFRRAFISGLLSSTGVERVKAVVRTETGDVAFNGAGDVLTELPLRDLDDSRVEVIAREGFRADEFEAALLSASRRGQN